MIHLAASATSHPHLSPAPRAARHGEQRCGVTLPPQECAAALEAVRALHQALVAAAEGGYRSLAAPAEMQPLHDGIRAAAQLLGAHAGDPARFTAIHNQPISDATPADLATWFAFLAHRERVLPGLVASTVHDGTLLALVRRLDDVLWQEHGMRVFLGDAALSIGPVGAQREAHRYACAS